MKEINIHQKWENRVLESMKGSQRAKPSADLFSKITSNLNKEQSESARTIPIRYLGIAACFLLVLNSAAIIQHINSNKYDSDMSNLYTDSSSIFSDYNIYEND